LWLLVGTSAGCACFHQKEEATAPVPQLKPEQRCVVFVADGAGDFRQASKNIAAAVESDKVPLAVETFVWSHGSLRVLADQLDCKNIRAEGHRLAQLILATRSEFPDRSICLLGHSAGSQVILAAADELPPASVQRIVLLNPSVQSNYDLRKALRTACDGIDVHCSTKDYWYLGVVVGVVSCFRGDWAPAAGIEGFKPVIEGPEDEILYTRLHHFPWNPELNKTGNDGGHYGGYQHGYLHAYILPRLTSEIAEAGTN
jgi:pimeloyl-ACP methyl ester carboxylesterase